jgi:hypothetical protein
MASVDCQNMPPGVRNTIAFGMRVVIDGHSNLMLLGWLIA